MIKLELYLPDWFFEGFRDAQYMVLKNQEPAAISEAGSDEWKIKSVRCAKCGECCLDVPPGKTTFGIDSEGKCNALMKDGDRWKCMAGGKTPFSCLPDSIHTKGCAVRY